MGEAKRRKMMGDYPDTSSTKIRMVFYAVLFVRGNEVLKSARLKSNLDSRTMTEAERATFACELMQANGIGPERGPVAVALAPHDDEPACIASYNKMVRDFGLKNDRQAEVRV